MLMSLALSIFVVFISLMQLVTGAQFLIIMFYYYAIHLRLSIFFVFLLEMYIFP